MNLRDVTAYMKRKSLTNSSDKRGEAAEIHKGPAKILQARVDNVIICQRDIFPEVVQYRIHAVWAAASFNIAISSLEYLD